MIDNVIIPQTCVVCGVAMANVSVVFCRSCRLPCELVALPVHPDLTALVPMHPLVLTPNAEPVAEIPEGTLVLLDFKSKCCGADIDIYPKSTCGADCHEAFVKRCEQEFGEFKKVVSVAGVAYKVPTRLIVETGLRAEDLATYPLWSE